MKKSILTVAVAALALAGCTKNETVAVADSNVIGFANAFVGNPTKAVEDVTTDNIKSFQVYGLRDNTEEIFDGIEVYESESPNVWIYDNPVTWQTGAYAIAAYSNGGAKGASTTTSTVDWTGTNLTITDYNAGTEQKDLLVAIASNTTELGSANVPVEFTFKHALSMIKFTLKSTIGDSEAATVTISNFVVKGIAPQGDLDYDGTDIAWTGVGETKDLNNTEEFKTTASKAGESDPFVVIPQTATFTVSFSAKLGTDGTPKTLSATISDQEFVPGYRYNFVATIDGADMDVITFADPEVTVWENNDWSIETPAGDLSSN